MNIVFGALIVVVACAVTISAMLLVRRRAPEGSYFSDGDRASGVFGVLATGFALLLGFMIFLAFESMTSRAREPKRRQPSSCSRSRRRSSCRRARRRSSPAS